VYNTFHGPISDKSTIREMLKGMDNWIWTRVRIA
jgi:hypothetical protein